MSDPVVANIIKSGAVVWTAPIGTSLPAKNTVGAGASWGAGWVRVGFTKEPVTLAYDSKEAEIEVEEYLASLDRYKTSESASMETVLAELTAEYLQLTMEGGLSTQVADVNNVGAETLDIGNDSTKPKRIWGFEGLRTDASGNILPVRVYILRGTAKLNGKLEFSKKKDTYPGVSLQVGALADPNNSGRIIKFERITAPKG